MQHKKLYLGLLVGTLATGLLVNQAEAVPSFARQTGMACAACHTVFPELNAFGRSFKENGYTLTGIKQVSAEESKSASGLSFDQIPPLSAMLQIDATNQNNAAAPKTTFLMPDQLSFFFAGEISPHMGSFIQMTMSPSESSGFAIDNTDIRYANHAGNITYGITVNNNPTVQDLWNSTPAWGFPFTGGPDTAVPIVGTDGLAENVMGLGAYADWGNGIYTELSLYRETGSGFDSLNVDAAGNPVYTARLKNPAPYYRIAWNKTFDSGDYLMVGVYGMKTELSQDTAYNGTADTYTDNAIDAQYEHPFSGSNNMLSVHASYTNEKRDFALSNLLDATDYPATSVTLKTTRLDGIYHWGYHATAALGYISSNGDGGAYDDTAFTGQVSYLPWQNTKFTLQYVNYTKVGGVTTDANKNNTAMVQAWLMW